MSLLPRFASLDDHGPELSANLDEQEAELLRDVFAILHGGEGAYIRYDASFDPTVSDDRLRGPKYRIDARVHTSFKDILISIAKLASANYSVRVFAEQYVLVEYGSVLNALACSLRSLHKQFMDFLSPLEEKPHQNNMRQLKLLKVYTHLLPFKAYMIQSKHLIKAFYNGTTKLNSSLIVGEHLLNEENLAGALSLKFPKPGHFKGGAVLRLITEMLRDSLGDSDAVVLFQELLNAVSQPYLRMLTEWLTTGTLNDPYDEFLVQKNTGFYVDNVGTQYKEYWNRRFACRLDYRPMAFDNKEIESKVVETGKYVNVILRDIGSSQTQSDTFVYDPIILAALQEVSSVEDPKMLTCIDDAHSWANSQLLRLLRTHKYGLSKFLEKLKQFYFFIGSNFLEMFLIFADKELLKPVRETEDVALRNALAMALDPEDTWSQFMSVSKAQRPLKESLTDVLLYHRESETRSDEGIGYDYLQFDFTPPFPLSVFISKRTIQRYQYLSRFLLEIKRTHSLVQRVWFTRLKDPAFVCFEFSDSVPEDVIRRASMLHDRMARFVSYLQNYCTVDGIELHWSSFYALLDSSLSVSELENQHNLYLNKSMDACFLTKENGLKYVLLLLTTAKKYSLFLQANLKAVHFITSDAQADDETTSQRRIGTVAWLGETIWKFQVSFEHSIKRFSSAISENASYSGLADTLAMRFKQQLRSLVMEPLSP